MRLVLAALISALVTLPAFAQQQKQCPIYMDLKTALLKDFNELPSGSGIAGQGKSAVIVFASPAGETWTMAIIGPDGRACIIASGEGWMEVIPPKAPVPGERSA